MKIKNKENDIEHHLAVFAQELLVRFGKDTAVSDEGIEKLLCGAIIQINEKNEKTLGTNCFHPAVALGMIQKYHIMQFYKDNIEGLIEEGSCE